MQYSYWEIKEWFTNIDFTIIGSGIVGLNCAIHLKNKYPKAKIVILEKGILPQGASTKNAGFSCFGSMTEIIDDLQTHTEQEVYNLIKKRWHGLSILRNNLGDKNINFKQNGGYELFKTQHDYENCIKQLPYINKLIKPIFKDTVFSFSGNTFGFKNVYQQYAVNKFEGQIDTGKMMYHLLKKTYKLGIKIVNNFTLEKYLENNSNIHVKTSGYDFYTKKLLITTNGFSLSLLNENVLPARAQVLITKPIKNLKIKGTFHLEKGYYYFRNINKRILFGGGRNLDFKTEETTSFGNTALIQNQLEKILQDVILPNSPFQIEHRWSGIMGVGNKKKAIVKQVSNHVYCGIRLGGMGVAIGSLIGKELADLT